MQKKYKEVFLLAVPMILQNVINNSLILIDTLMVGALGSRELAAVTLANSVFFVVMLFAFGIYSGGAVLISQYWGRGDTQTINRILGIMLAASGLIGLIVGLAGTFFPMAIANLTTDKSDLAVIAAGYIRVVSFSYLFTALSNAYLSALRSMEKPKAGTIILILSTCINTLLNYIFIFGSWGAPAMGVEGAAFATMLARIVEFAITGALFVRNKAFPIDWRALLRPGMVIFRDFRHFATPVILNEALWGLGFSLYPILLGHLPADPTGEGVAAFSVAVNIERLLGGFTFGIGGAIAILIGKTLGESSMGDDEIFAQAKSYLRLGILVGLVATCVMIVFSFTVIVPVLLPLLGATETMTKLIKPMLMLSAAIIPIRTYNFSVIVGILRGGGDVVAAAILDIVSMYLLGLPLAALAGFVFNWGAFGVFAVMFSEEFWKMLASRWRLYQRKWIRNLTRDFP